nr:MAG: hypothetical protein [Reoviridae sp.]
MDTIAEGAKMQAEVIEKMEEVHDAYGTVALGSSGMRNKEVTTRPTTESLQACYKRASPIEQEKAEVILDSVGQRLGIVSKKETQPPSSLVSETFKNAQTTFGTVEKVKEDGKKIAKSQNDILFSVMHSSGPLLADAGVLQPGNWETGQIIGSIIQNVMPASAAVYPNGHYFIQQDIVNTKFPLHSTTGADEYSKCALSVYAYSLPQIDDTRTTRLILSGQITIVRQPYNPLSPIKLGMVYQGRDGLMYFNAAVFINTSYAASSTTQMVGLNSVQDYLKVGGSTNVYDDAVNRFGLWDPTGVVTQDSIQEAKRTDTLKTLMAQRFDVKADPALFSYSSQWQVVVNMSNCIPVDPLDVFEVTGWSPMGRFSAALVAIYPENFNMSVSVQIPFLNVTVIRPPRTLRHIGREYNGTIIDLLGMIPDWYSTQDLHEPWAIYYRLCTPLINKAGKIADKHVKSGAAYNFTVAHITDARVISGLSVLTDDGMQLHVRELITDIAKWMSVEGPVAPYRADQRKRLFMRIAEVVMFQTMTNIAVFTTAYSRLSMNYLRDCEEQNVIERRMDKALLQAITN